MKTKLKKLIKPSFFILVLMFITVYIMSLTGYYSTIENKNNTLTAEAIERFERDILNGEKINAENYLVEKKTYDNLLSRTGIKIGNLIELLFDKMMHFILSEIEGAIR